MNCKDCIHNEVCHMWEICSKKLGCLGCLDFIASAENGLRMAIAIFLACVRAAERKHNIQAPLKKHLNMIVKKIVLYRM